MTIKLPKTPDGWATRLTTLLLSVKGESYLPVKVKELASEYSLHAFPKFPITMIKGMEECDGFEGMLVPNPHKNGEWGIIYNASGNSIGRHNFSIAHELGHYLLHRERYPNGKKCTNRDMMDWSSEEAQIEGEANQFAASLLMPWGDFRNQVQQHPGEVGFDLFDRLTERYEVSLSAAILRWLSYTQERAMIVVSKDGFIDWAWSSKPLLRTNIYYKPKQETIELPSKSLAALRDPLIDNRSGVIHPAGVWLGDEEVKEMAIFSNDYGNMTISLLRYPKYNTKGFVYEEEEVEDVVNRFSARFERGE